MPITTPHPAPGEAGAPVEIEANFGQDVCWEIHRLWTPGLAGQVDEDWNLPVIFPGFEDPSRHLRVSLRCDGRPVGWIILTTTVQLRGRMFGGKAPLIEYLSVAPWCRSRRICADARFPQVVGVGQILLGVVGRVSELLGHGGAFCFFAEGASDGWYRAFLEGIGRDFERLPSESDGTGFFPYYEVAEATGLAVAARCGVPVLAGLLDDDG